MNVNSEQNDGAMMHVSVDARKDDGGGGHNKLMQVYPFLSQPSNLSRARVAKQKTLSFLENRRIQLC